MADSVDFDAQWAELSAEQGLLDVLVADYRKFGAPLFLTISSLGFGLTYEASRGSAFRYSDTEFHLQQLALKRLIHLEPTGRSGVFRCHPTPEGVKLVTYVQQKAHRPESEKIPSLTAEEAGLSLDPKPAEAERLAWTSHGQQSTTATDVGKEVGSDKRTMSWGQIRQKFLQGAKDHPDMFAQWDARQELWKLLAGQGNGSSSPEAERLFKQSARLAVSALGIPWTEGQPWHVWLNLMRKQKRGFERPLKTRSWGQFRRIMEAEGPVDTSDVPLGADGRIAHVFQTSADFCEDLAPAVGEETSTAVAEDGSAKSDRACAAEPHAPVCDAGGRTESWHTRLRAARQKARLSRHGAVNALKTKGVAITTDAIKKHEEGAAKPRPDVRKAYASIYAYKEDELFPPGE